jgi:Protein of unknown function (DUF1573)
MKVARALAFLALSAAVAAADDAAPPATDAAPATPTTATQPAASSSAPAGAAATATNPASPATTADGATAVEPTVEPVPQPKLSIEKPIQDLGKVLRGKKIEADFTIANEGDAPLKIKDAQPSCGCTVASFDKEIDVGATGKVHALIDTAAFDGPIAKTITVLTNDPASPRALLTIKADVSSFVRYSPAAARLLLVANQEVPKTSINFWATDNTDLGTPSVKSTVPYVIASLRKAEAGERVANAPDVQWRIDVTMSPDSPPGPIAGEILVRTNHPQQAELHIPLSGFVRNVLQAQPQIADFGVFDRGATTPKKFVLKLFNFGKDAVEIRSVATDLPFVSAAATAEDAGRRYRIELRLAPDAPKGKFNGTLKIETSSPAMPVVELPVRGKVG